jgi:hypothetical protein
MVLRPGYFGKTDQKQKFLDVMLEKIRQTDHVRNSAVLRTVKGEKDILRTIKRRKANWIGHILRRNCLIKHVIEGKVTGARKKT